MNIKCCAYFLNSFHGYVLNIWEFYLLFVSERGKKGGGDYSIGQQPGVTCLPEYATRSIGIFIFNPIDNILSSFYNRKVDVDSLALLFVSLQFCLWYFLER